MQRTKLGQDGASPLISVLDGRRGGGGVTQRFGLAALLLVGALTLGSCYDFDAPVDATPGRPLDPALLGTWRCLGVAPKADAKPANFVVTAARERVYSIRFEAEDEEPDLYEGHASEVSGHILLNIRDLDPRFPTKPWTFARSSFLLPDVLRVQLVDDDALKGVKHTPVALRAALERLDAMPALYVDFCVCLRAAAESQGPAK
jgi:hypothetical protein